MHFFCLYVMQVISRVLFHCLLLNNISIINLCDLPIAALKRSKPHEIKRVALNYRNLFGLSTPEVCPTQTSLLMPVSSYLTFSLSPGHLHDQATWFSVALSVIKTFLFLYPPFQVADYPVVPGLSSVTYITAIELLAPKYT